MHRFYLPPERCSGTALCLEGREAHHALHVLRVRRGECVTVLDGTGGECLCRLQARESDRVSLAVLERRRHPLPPFQITLVQALPKGKIIESIIQKSTELGVSRIVPLLTERVVAHLENEAGGAKAVKWRAVAVEAIKQCGSPWLPKVDDPTTLQQFLARGESPELALVGSLQGRSGHPREHFSDFQKTHGRKPASVSIWVGPEGDFTPAEFQLLQAARILPITLGPLILRSETAAIYSLSVVLYELQSPVCA